MSGSQVPVVAYVVLIVLGLSLLLAVTIFLIATIKSYVLPITFSDPKESNLRENDDPAWHNYLVGGGKVEDFAHLRRLETGMLRRGFKGGWWGKFPLLFLSWPILIIASLVLLVLNLVLALSLIVVGLIGGAAFTVLRLSMAAVENTAAKVRGSQASCPMCYAVMNRPAYVCPGCAALHRDIRASTRGAIWRVCTCGQRLPTGVLRASSKLKAVCQECGEEVHRGAAVFQDVRVAVFGEPHAGKTRLILAGIHELIGTARSQGAELRFTDDRSKERAEAGLGLVRREQRTHKTEWEVSPALTCEIRAGKRGALLHTFDAAGERFRGGEHHDDMRFIDAGHTLIFVVDPFAIPGVRALLAIQPRTKLIEEHLEDESRNPEESYGEVVSRVRNAGGNTGKQRLAVVVTKVDLLAQAQIQAPTLSAEIRQWLYDNGMHNLVLAVQREFREVRYFAVASVARQSWPGNGPAGPFSWALATRRADVMAEPHLAGATA